jgi:methylmalonyl-CoA mutase C-terminal domain/subunit
VALTQKIIKELQINDALDIRIVIGGTIPASDAVQLRDLGVADVFPTGVSLAEMVERMGRLTAQTNEP